MIGYKKRIKIQIECVDLKKIHLHITFCVIDRIVSKWLFVDPFKNQEKSILVEVSFLTFQVK